jgi:hypothetical protein
MLYTAWRESPRFQPNARHNTTRSRIDAMRPARMSLMRPSPFLFLILHQRYAPAADEVPYVSALPNTALFGFSEGIA